MQLQKELDAAKKELDAMKRKDLDAAKAAADKAEQANEDTQAKIKALEEENANLKKRLPAKIGLVTIRRWFRTLQFRF